MKNEEKAEIFSRNSWNFSQLSWSKPYSKCKGYEALLQIFRCSLIKHSQLSWKLNCPRKKSHQSLNRELNHYLNNTTQIPLKIYMFKYQNNRQSTKWQSVPKYTTLASLRLGKHSNSAIYWYQLQAALWKQNIFKMIWAKLLNF